MPMAELPSGTTRVFNGGGNAAGRLTYETDQPDLMLQMSNSRRISIRPTLR